MWSDIDIAFGVRTGSDIAEVMDAFTAAVGQRHPIADRFDIHIATWAIRVFWLDSTLQIDLAFVPESDFCAIGPSFKLLLGACQDRPHLPPPEATYLIGWGWLYAIHVRSAITRGRLWQAEYMISGLRDTVLTLACLRLGLETAQARGVHLLPVEETGPLAGALVRELTTGELIRAFRVAIDALLGEVLRFDGALATRLKPPLLQLATDIEAAVA